MLISIDSLTVNCSYRIIDKSYIIQLIQSITQPDTILAIIAIVISIVAIYYNRQTFILNKKHNILSSKPLLVSFLEAEVESGNFAIGIANNGLGPAIIEDILIKYNDKLFKDFRVLINEISLQEIDYSYTLNEIKITNLTTEYCLSEKANIIFLKFNICDTKPEYRDLFFRKIIHFEINLKYNDIYGTKYELNDKLEY